MVLAVALGAFLWLGNPTPTLAAQLIEHAHGEAFALVTTSEHAPAEDVRAVLQRAGVRLKPGAMHVSYAMTCPFRGREVPHLVVQTADGPVTVFVLTNEQAGSASREFAEEGFVGVIVPAPQGALAVLSRGAPVAQAAELVLGALEYDSAG